MTWLTFTYADHKLVAKLLSAACQANHMQGIISEVKRVTLGRRVDLIFLFEFPRFSRLVELDATTDKMLFSFDSIDSSVSKCIQTY